MADRQARVPRPASPSHRGVEATSATCPDIVNHACEICRGAQGPAQDSHAPAHQLSRSPSVDTPSALPQLNLRGAAAGTNREGWKPGGLLPRRARIFHEVPTVNATPPQQALGRLFSLDIAISWVYSTDRNAESESMDILNATEIQMLPKKQTKCHPRSKTTPASANQHADN